MPLGAFIEKDAKSPLGYRINRQTGSVWKQALASAGLKVEAEPAARSKMYSIAEPFRDSHNNASAGRPVSDYAELRKRLDNEDRNGAQTEIRRLVQEGGKTLEMVGKALCLRQGGKVAPELFSGSLESERKMLPKLTPEQRRVYVAAQKERIKNAQLFAEIASGMKNLLNRDGGSKASALATVAIRNGNPGLARSMEQSGAISQSQLEAARRQAAKPMQASGKKMLGIDELMAASHKR